MELGKVLRARLGLLFGVKATLSLLELLVQSRISLKLAQLAGQIYHVARTRDPAWMVRILLAVRCSVN